MRNAAPALLSAVLLVAACERPGAATGFVLESDGAELEVVFEPFSLEIRRPDGTVAARTLPSPVAVGIAEAWDPGRYYDPELSADRVRYVVATDLVDHMEEDGAWRLRFDSDEPGRTFTLTVAAEDDGSFAFSVRTAPLGAQVVHARLSFEGLAAERYYGLGEFFDHPEHHGRVRNLRFDLDGTTEAAYNMMHVKVPSYTSTTGFGLLLRNPEPLVADMGSAGPVHLTVVSDRFDGHLVARNDPVETVARLQRHAGLQPMWPEWVFAPQQWRNTHGVTCSIPCEEGCDAIETGWDLLFDDALAMREHDLPGSLIWIDAPWQTGFSTFEFNPVQYPDAETRIEELHALGYRLSVHAAPFVNRADDSGTMCGMEGANAGGLYTYAEANGYLVVDRQGRPMMFPWRGSQGSLVDFTNPDAFEWWKSLLQRATEIGVEGFKLDWDEYVVASIGEVSLEEDYVFHDGTSAIVQQSRYNELFHRAHFEALVGTHGGPRYTIARTGNAFDAAVTTAVWPGDLCNNFEEWRAPGGADGKVHAGGLPAAVSAGVSLAPSLHPHYGSDIGGYRHGMPSKEVLGRWIQFGALSTVMQLGGGGRHHNPWDFDYYDQELLDLYRKYARLHMDLFPYLYSETYRNHLDGTPIIRPLGLDFPDDLEAIDARHQYLFGPDLLVAPVVVEARSREVVFPEGRWIGWWDDEVVQGPARLTVDAPFDFLPLYVREGAIVPMLTGDVDTLAPASVPGIVSLEDRPGDLAVRAYPGLDRTYEIYDGTRLTLTSSGDGVNLSVGSRPSAGRMVIRLHWASVSSSPPETVTLDGAALPAQPDPEALDAAGSGYWYDAGRGVLHARFDVGAGNAAFVVR